MHYDPTNMSREQRDAWNARTPTVTVRDPCPCCNTLQPAVIERFAYSPAYLRLKSCQGCFDAEQKRRFDEKRKQDEQERQSIGHFGMY